MNILGRGDTLEREIDLERVIIQVLDLLDEDAPCLCYRDPDEWDVALELSDAVADVWGLLHDAMHDPVSFHGKREMEDRRRIAEAKMPAWQRCNLFQPIKAKGTQATREGNVD